MGYPQRYFEPGYACLLTARCHNREYLLGQESYRTMMVDALFAYQDRYQVPVLNYMVTSNHIHLLVLCPDDTTAIPGMMRSLSSKVAASYNKQSGRQGSFWERRYHATAVESGDQLVRCSLYLDTNMIRAGVVKHPSEWKHCGYHEIVKPKQRYKIVNLSAFARLAGVSDESSFLQAYSARLEDLIVTDELCREAVWTTDLAVGSREFVEHVRRQSGYSIARPGERKDVRGVVSALSRESEKILMTAPCVENVNIG